MKIQKIISPKEQELDELMEIWYRTNLTAHYFILADYWKSHYEEVKRALPEAGIYAVYAKKDQKEQKDQILGFAGLTGSYIAGLFVKEEWQSHGIGKMIIDRIKEEKDSLELHVFAENKGAVRFYIREGFEILEEQRNSDTGKLEYQMVWSRAEGDGSHG